MINFIVLILGIATNAKAMSPASSAAGIAPRASIVGFGNIEGAGLGVSLITRRSARDERRSGTTTIGNPNSERLLNQRTDLLLDYRILARTTVILDVPHVYNSATSNAAARQRANALGDLALYAKQSFYQDRQFKPTRQISALVGIKLPTGSTTIKNDVGTRLDATLQPGSGTTDFIVGAAAYWGLSRANLYGDATYKHNTRAAYTFGNSIGVNAGLSIPIERLTWLSLTTEANLEIAERDKSIEALPTLLPGGSVRDTGGQTLYLTPGIQVRPVPNLTLSFSVQLPVYQNLNGTQLASGPNLNLGVFTRIGG